MEVLGVIEEGLVLLNKLVPDQATKIANKVLALRQRYDQEYAKKDLRDDALLHSFRVELRDIRELYRAASASALAQNKP